MEGERGHSHPHLDPNPTRSAQGYILRVLTTGNPDEMRFRQKLDSVNFMMEDSNIDKSVRHKVWWWMRL